MNLEATVARVDRQVLAKPHFPRFLEYRDSAVRWLGKVPKDWRVVRLRFLCCITTGGRDTQDAEEDGEYPFFVRSDNIERISTWSFDGEGVLTSGDGAGVGKVFHHYVGKMEIHQRVYLFHDFRHVTARYFYYFLKENLYKVVLEGGAKSTVDSLRRPMLADFSIAFPSISEQEIIVAFLDRETARIDELIAKKAAMIERIDEKWRAYLTRLVTRGMDINTELRPTGRPWCQFIRHSWDLLPLRRFIVHIEQGWSPRADQRAANDDEWAVLKVGAVLRGRFRAEENKALPPELEPETRYLIEEGDLLLTRGNTPELVADACIVPSTRSRLLLSDLHYRIVLDESKLRKRFACYWLLSRVGRYQIEADARGTSNSMVKVSQQHIRAWLVPVLPITEQDAICDALDAERQKLNTVASQINKAIQRLKEYRSALIHTAVTGQIDVRNCRSEAPCP